MLRTARGEEHSDGWRIAGRSRWGMDDPGLVSDSSLAGAEARGERPARSSLDRRGAIARPVRRCPQPAPPRDRSWGDAPTHPESAGLARPEQGASGGTCHASRFPGGQSPCRRAGGKPRGHGSPVVAVLPPEPRDVRAPCGRTAAGAAEDAESYSLVVAGVSPAGWGRRARRVSEAALYGYSASVSTDSRPGTSFSCYQGAAQRIATPPLRRTPADPTSPQGAPCVDAPQPPWRRRFTASRLKRSGSNQPPTHSVRSSCSGCSGSARAARSSA